MSDLLKLAERCEAATGPDRELEAHIWCALHGKKYMGHNIAYGTEDVVQVEFTEPPKRACCVSGRYLPHASPWTSSLDAAMTLVPDSYDWAVFKTNGGLTVHAWCGDRTDIFAATPELALCAASLRARAEIARLSHDQGA
jgi:hypothetical protein